jgi:pimeloyl-ACP methyl ester carboxylesterase
VDPWAFLDSPDSRPSPGGLASRIGVAIGRTVDELSLRYEARIVPRASEDTLRRRAERLREALEFLDRSGILGEPERLFLHPGPLEGLERRPARSLGLPPFESIRFPSRSVAVFPPEMGTAAADPSGRNGFARAYLWRSGDRGRAAVVCLHGYRGGFAALDARAFSVPRLVAAGFDVALAVLPYHGPRTPQGSTSGRYFLNDPRRTLEAAVQAADDVRRLLRWLRSEGARVVGLLGLSLGAYLAAWIASFDPDPDFVVALLPVASLADLFWDRMERRGEASPASAAGITRECLRRLFAPHCPLVRPPRVERRLVIAAAADRIAPPGHAAALAAHWKTTVQWLPGGHLLPFGRAAALRRLRDLVSGA